MCLQTEKNPKLSRMYLINVKAVLDIERSKTSAETNVLQPVEKDYNDHALMEQRYAILSHRWQGDEISFKDMEKLTNSKLQTCSGRKVVGTCEVAQKENLKWVWIDSCCIGNNVNARGRAINLMYRWYRCSQTCYTYLHDVTKDSFPRKANEPANSEWFSRGWTLQELIAPRVLEFFDQSWQPIGNRRDHAATLSKITRVPQILLDQTDGPGASRTLTDTFGVAQIMSWAADRETRMPEDRAYSLVGLFGVSLPALYGIGGQEAFQILQDTIIKQYRDQSILSWSGQANGNVLAESPSDFQKCFDVVPWRPSSWPGSPPRPPFQMVQESITTRLRLTRCRGSSYIFQAELACCHSNDDPSDRKPIVINLAEVSNIYYRISGDFRPSDETEEQNVHLWCHPIDSSFKFNIMGLLETIGPEADHWNRSYDHDAIDIQNGQRDVMHILNGQHKAIRYERLASSAGHLHDKDFSIILGFFGGRISVHVAHDGPSEKVTPDAVHHANCMDRLREENFNDPASNFELIMHYHIPRTIQALRVVYKSDCWRGGSVALDILKCFGCCMPGWMSVGMVRQHNNDVAECFRKIKQSYFIVSPLELKNVKLLLWTFFSYLMQRQLASYHLK